MLAWEKATIANFDHPDLFGIVSIPDDVIRTDSKVKGEAIDFNAGSLFTYCSPASME